MSTRKLSLFASIFVAALGLSSGTTTSAGPPLTYSQLQSLSSEGPTWHANDGSVYDPNGGMTRSRSMPSDGSSVNAYAGSSSGAASTGSQAQPIYQGSLNTE